MKYENKRNFDELVNHVLNGKFSKELCSF